MNESIAVIARSETRWHESGMVRVSPSATPAAHHHAFRMTANRRIDLATGDRRADAPS